MVKYIFKRIGYSVLTLFVLITITFILMHLMPGRPFTGTKEPPIAVRKAIEARYGLDKPPVVQYGIFIKNLFTLDFGESMTYKNRTIVSMLREGFPRSFELGLRALIFAVIGGVLLGTFAAVNRGKIWDSMAILIAVLGVSVPSFVLGALLQYFIGLEFTRFTQKVWGWEFTIFPVSGWDTWYHTLLPSFALGMGALASITRLMRSSMLDVLGQDYIKTAKSKGLSGFKIITKHSIRNAIIPVVTYLGPLSAALLTGAFVVEKIFGIAGIGNYFVESVMSKDYQMIAGLTLFYEAFLILANMLVDIAYGIIDPRIRLIK